jgi:hypothetical protein
MHTSPSSLKKKKGNSKKIGPWQRCELPRNSKKTTAQLSVCGYKKFSLDTLGDHVNTCTAQEVSQKTYDCVVEQLPDLFPTTVL